MRAARAATSPALLGAPQARCNLPEPRFADTAAVFAANTNTRGLGGKGCSLGAIWVATSSAVQSQRSGDRHRMSDQRAALAATR